MTNADRRCPECQNAIPAGSDRCIHCAPDASTPATPRFSDAFFASFEILEILGRGGMGTVFKARQRRLDRTVCIKLVNIVDAEMQDRFLQEGRLLAQLQHPRIISVFDAGVDQNIPYLVCEYVEGRSLRRVLDEEGPQPLLVGLDITSQILEGLAAAHVRDVIHRDIKPENVLITADRQVKIADFGLARSSKLDLRRTSSGMLIGTPTYMAPEQIAKQPIGPGVDLYSTGVVMFELLAGRPPFEGPAALDVLNKHVSAPVPRISEAVPELDLPPEVDTLVQRSLAKTPAGRYPSASAFLDAVTDVKLLYTTNPRLAARARARAGTARSSDGRQTVVVGAGARAPQTTRISTRLHERPRWAGLLLLGLGALLGVALNGLLHRATPLEPAGVGTGEIATWAPAAGVSASAPASGVPAPAAAAKIPGATPRVEPSIAGASPGQARSSVPSVEPRLLAPSSAAPPSAHASAGSLTTQAAPAADEASPGLLPLRAAPSGGAASGAALPNASGLPGTALPPASPSRRAPPVRADALEAQGRLLAARALLVDRRDRDTGGTSLGTLIDQALRIDPGVDLLPLYAPMMAWARDLASQGRLARARDLLYEARRLHIDRPESDAALDSAEAGLARGEGYLVLTITPPQRRYRVGGAFRLNAFVDRRGYLTVFLLEPDGTRNALYPIGAAAALPAGTTAVMPAPDAPGPGSGLRFDQAGPHVVYALVTDAPVVVPGGLARVSPGGPPTAGKSSPAGMESFIRALGPQVLARHTLTIPVDPAR